MYQPSRGRWYDGIHGNLIRHDIFSGYGQWSTCTYEDACHQNNQRSNHKHGCLIRSDLAITLTFFVNFEQQQNLSVGEVLHFREVKSEPPVVALSLLVVFEDIIYPFYVFLAFFRIALALRQLLHRIRRFITFCALFRLIALFLLLNFKLCMVSIVLLLKLNVHIVFHFILYMIQRRVFFIIKVWHRWDTIIFLLLLVYGYLSLGLFQKTMLRYWY